jgi:hypothetical protein
MDEPLTPDAPEDSSDTLSVSSLLNRCPKCKAGWIFLGLRSSPGHERVEAKV